MFAKKQNCSRCKSSIKEDFDFCPHCGHDMRNPQKEMEEFGLLGKNEFSNAPLVGGGSTGFGITDKIISSIARKISIKYKKDIHAHLFLESDLKHKEDKLIKDILRNGRVLV